MALLADVVKRGGVRDDLYIVDGLYLRIRAVPALLSSVVFAGVRADGVRFGIRYKSSIHIYLRPFTSS